MDASPSLRIHDGNLLLLALSGHNLTGRLSLTSSDAVERHGCLNEALVGSPPLFASAVPSRSRLST